MNPQRHELESAKAAYGSKIEALVPLAALHAPQFSLGRRPVVDRGYSRSILAVFLC